MFTALRIDAAVGESLAVLAALSGIVGTSREAAFDKVADILDGSFTLGFLDSLVLGG